MRAVFAGLATLDVIQRVDRLPGADDKVTSVDAVVAAGGPAANAAKTFAALGGRPRLLTVLGAGAAGRLVRALLEQAGVEVIDLADPESEPPVASVLVTASTGQRAIVNASGGVQLSVGDLRTQLAGASVVLLDGHHPALALAAARAAHPGVPVVLDAGRPKPIWDDLLPLTDIAVCSADFRTPAAPDATPGETAEALVALGIERGAITAGAGPIRWWDATDGRHRTGQLAPRTIAAVDTLGAGDVLHGAFCFHLASGLGFVEALAAASELATQRCETRGLDAWLGSLVARPRA